MKEKIKNSSNTSAFIKSVLLHIIVLGVIGTNLPTTSKMKALTKDPAVPIASAMSNDAEVAQTAVVDSKKVDEAIDTIRQDEMKKEMARKKALSEFEHAKKARIEEEQNIKKFKAIRKKMEEEQEQAKIAKQKEKQELEKLNKLREDAQKQLKDLEKAKLKLAETSKEAPPKAKDTKKITNVNKASKDVINNEKKKKVKK
jgi:hypothetical protein